MPGSRPGVDRRRQRRAVLDDEQVRLRALGELAAVVAHHAFEAAAAKRLLHRERVVQQVVRLDQRVHRCRDGCGRSPTSATVTPRSNTSGGGSTFGLTMTTIDGVGAGGRIVGQLADAARDAGSGCRPRDPGCRRGRPRASSRGSARRSRASVSGTAQREHAGRLAQPPHVAVEEERLAVVGPQRLVDALAVQKPVIEHRDDGVLLIGHAAVDVDRRCHEASVPPDAIRDARTRSLSAEHELSIAIALMPCVRVLTSAAT